MCASIFSKRMHKCKVYTDWIEIVSFAIHFTITMAAYTHTDRVYILFEAHIKTTKNSPCTDFPNQSRLASHTHLFCCILNIFKLLDFEFTESHLERDTIFFSFSLLFRLFDLVFFFFIPVPTSFSINRIVLDSFC